MPAMLPTGEVVTSISTRELLELTDGVTNFTLSFLVTQVSEVKTSQKGMPYMHVYGENDEEEPLKLNVWGQAAIAKFQGRIQPGGLYKFTGVKVADSKPQYRYAHLPYDFHLYDWGTADLVQGDFHPTGLQLKSHDEINPYTDWRIRCRGVVSQHFTRYMRFASALTGPVRIRHDLVLQVTLRSVPMAYINSFTPDTEVELVGSVWDFDVMKWSDVRNSSALSGNAMTVGATKIATPPAEKTPPTPMMPSGDRFVFPSGSGTAPGYPQTPLSHRHAPSNAVMLSPAVGGATPAPATNCFTGFKKNLEGMIVQEPQWEEQGNHYRFLVSITDDGKPKVLRVVTTQMLSDISASLKRGSRVTLTGEVVHSRLGFSMDAQKVLPSLSTHNIKAMPTSFSDADNIHGHARMWHKIHADVISEFVCDDQDNAYSGYVLVHDSAKSIHVQLTEVPDEAVPLLCLFAELDLVGIISGEDDSLEMNVSWKHAAFHNMQEQTQGPSGVKTIKPPTAHESRNASRSSEKQSSPKEQCATESPANDSSPAPALPVVDLSKVKREDNAPIDNKNTRKRGQAAKNDLSAAKRHLRGQDKNKPAAGKRAVVPPPIITIDAADKDGSCAVDPQALSGVKNLSDSSASGSDSVLGQNIESESVQNDDDANSMAAEDDAASGEL